MTIHSQGPWRAVAPPTADNGNPWRVVDQFNHGIAIVTCSPREGNAKLIAAAPTMESELDALRAENERLRAEHDDLVRLQKIAEMGHLAALGLKDNEIERLRAALEWYAQAESRVGWVSEIERDGGQRAREALAGPKRA